MKILTALCFILTISIAHAADAVSQFGITWKFDHDYSVGQYANGDYYVVAPCGVKIISITPKSEKVAGRTTNGSMVNPAAGPAAPQAFDSVTEANSFVEALNVARPNGKDLSADNPLILPTNSSLVSSISDPAVKVRPQLTSAAVLTIVPTALPQGTFRPPYDGTDKTHRWHVSDLDFSKLQRKPLVANAPLPAQLQVNFTRPWIEICTEWGGRFLHPALNQRDYGRDMAYQTSDALLALQLDYSDADKLPLLIGVTQYGIDVYGAALAGGIWMDNGGHNMGRKMPMLLAGRVLNDARILAMGDGEKHHIFQEDRQTWIVTAADVGRNVLAPRVSYPLTSVGVAEWGEKHTAGPTRDNSSWGASYRDINSDPLLGHALTAELMGVVGYWNWPAYFAYTNRAYKINGSKAYPKFAATMWAAYHHE